MIDRLREQTAKKKAENVSSRPWFSLKSCEAEISLGRPGSVWVGSAEGEVDGDLQGSEGT